jgi:hypothetical protein
LYSHQESCAPIEDGQEGDEEANSRHPSSFDDTNLKKAKKEGFLSELAEIIFPWDEAIPASPVGYRVMFLAFLFRGLFHPAHEFLRGFLFVYSVQLHQLTPNSLLNIACFIILYEAFLGIDPH